MDLVRGLTYLHNVFFSHVQLNIDRCFLLSKLLLNFNYGLNKIHSLDNFNRS